MKAKLEFNLPQEQIEFNDCLNGNSYKSILRELDTYLRNKIKYNDDTLNNDEIGMCEKIRDTLYTLIEEHNVTIEDN